MPFLIGLLPPLFTQPMCPFNSLLLSLATAHQSLYDIAAIRSISILLMAVITARITGSFCEGSLSVSACHEVGTSRLTNRSSCCSISFSESSSRCCSGGSDGLSARPAKYHFGDSIRKRPSSSRSSFVPLMFSR